MVNLMEKKERMPPFTVGRSRSGRVFGHQLTDFYRFNKNCKMALFPARSNSLSVDGKRCIAPFGNSAQGGGFHGFNGFNA